MLAYTSFSGGRATISFIGLKLLAALVKNPSQQQLKLALFASRSKYDSAIMQFVDGAGI